VIKKMLRTENYSEICNPGKLWDQSPFHWAFLSSSPLPDHMKTSSSLCQFWFFSHLTLCSSQILEPGSQTIKTIC
jgi:hypothetical protein